VFTERTAGEMLYLIFISIHIYGKDQPRPFPRYVPTNRIYQMNAFRK
jgi:hypothetical protein